MNKDEIFNAILEKEGGYVTILMIKEVRQTGDYSSHRTGSWL
jgi:hypothetical protein